MTLDEWKQQAEIGDICRLDEGEPTGDDGWAQPMIVMRISEDEFIFVNLEKHRSHWFTADLLYRGGLLRADEPVTPAQLIYK